MQVMNLFAQNLPQGYSYLSSISLYNPIFVKHHRIPFKNCISRAAKITKQIHIWLTMRNMIQPAGDYDDCYSCEIFHILFAHLSLNPYPCQTDLQLTDY